MVDSDGSWEIVQTPFEPEPDQVIRHVLVRQLLAATQLHDAAPFAIEGKGFKRFILVGNLCSFQQGPASQNFDLTDGTGMIKASIWNNNVGGNQIADCADFLYYSMPYVRVIGELESYRSSRTVRVLSVEPAQNPHAPYHHILQAIHDTLVYERGPPPQSASSSLESPSPQAVDAPLEWPSFSGDTQTTPPNSPPPFVPIVPAESVQSRGARSKSSSNNNGPVPPRNIIAAAENSSASVTPRREKTPNTSVHTQDGRGRIPKTPPPQKQSHARILSPSSPQTPSTSPRSIRSMTPRRDPYSHLTSLQRDILLCIKNAQSEYERQYDTTDGWEGVYFPVIIQAASASRPNLDLDILMDSIEGLFKQEYIFNIQDDHHYGCD